MKENYFAGMDCTCSAYGESECGCGADWTDARIYKLQAEIGIRDSRIKELEGALNQVARVHRLPEPFPE